MEKVLLGLDLGTDSVGWCATDENGKIIKKNGKSLWGYHGFEMANAAADRRSHRSNRRRLNRRKERLDLLREIFKEEIGKRDPSFYYRLDNSFYHNEDREHPFEYTLFNDKNYTDKQYYDEYPTIYHLRKELIETNEKADIRKIYLAMHHMIKYRGNFLNSQEDFKPMQKENIQEYFETLNAIIDNNFIEFNNDVFNELIKINKQKLTIQGFKENYNKVLNPTNDKFLKDAIIPLMIGSEVPVEKLKLEPLDDLKKISVNDDKFDENINKILNENPDNERIIGILKSCKAIYEFFLMGRLLGEGNSFISKAMVDRYDKHHNELELLKKYVKENIPDKYNEIFRDLKDGLNNYARYVGSTNYLNEVKREKHCSRDDFYKFLKKELGIEKYDDSEKNKNDYLFNVYVEISRNNYLERQNSRENGIFPYQLNKREMKIILEKQSKYYPFLLEKDGEYTNIDKIISLLTYKIPYYVGPLISPKLNDDGDRTERSKFSWIVRAQEKIYPWNFEKVVDLEKTAREFITRMLTKCTYLSSCYCMPKHSILYSYYNVLTHINKINVNGRPLDKEQKLNLINDVYKNINNKTICKKTLEDYFKVKYNTNDVSITTSNDKESKNFDFNMGSYIDFVKIFGKEYVDENLEQIEKIIRDITIFEDKTILTSRLQKEYKLSNDQIKKIKGLNYSKYSSVSKELLTDIIYYEIDSSGEVLNQKNIINVLEENNVTLQEVIYNETYRFDKLIREYNLKNNPDLKNETIEEYVKRLGFVSPGMKRPMIQAYKIIEEVEKILNHRIDEYYVECTRTNKDKNKGKDKKSRKELVQEFYKQLLGNKKIDKETRERAKYLKDKANALDVSKFQGEKLYLYFTQLGRCMYSGEIIEFNDLMDYSKYDVDHIYPQSLIKDDSVMNNKVLVKQGLNRIKDNIYPLPSNMLWNGNRKAANDFYKFLKNNKFITEEKYNRLTKIELSESEYENFVNRQLVYTNQAVKGLIGAIKTLKTTNDFEPKVVYSKGENISDFRHKYNILKSRNINNFHHAHDAYLNIIIGRTIDNHFTYYQKKYNNKEYIKQMYIDNVPVNVLKIFEQNKKYPKKDVYDKDGSLIWSYETSLKEIEYNIYERFDIFSTERTYTKNTILKSATIYPANKANFPISCKNNINKYESYGGLKDISYGMYMLILCKNKYRIIAIPTLYKNNTIKINEYLSQKKILGTNDFKIIINNLKINTIIETKKLKFAFTGKDSETSYCICNKIERIFSKEEILIVKKIEKVIEKIGKDEDTDDNLCERGMNYEDDNSLIIYYSKNKEDQKNIDKFKINKLTKEEMKYVYNKMIERFSKECFAYSSTIAIKNLLISKIKEYEELSIVNECKLIFNLLNYMKCNSTIMPDLTLIGGSKKPHSLNFSNTLSNCKIVYESITGYYRKEYRIE